MAAARDPLRAVAKRVALTHPQVGFKPSFKAEQGGS